MTSSSSKTDPEPLPDRVLVGVVSRPHGLRGDVVVEVESDREERFRRGSSLAATLPDGRELRLVVAASRDGQRGRLVVFEGHADRDAAERLRGARLEVARSEVPPAREGEYYHFELVGCRAVDARAGDLGIVVEVEQGAGDLLLVVEDPDGKRLRLPFVEAFVERVDREARRIDWTLPEGLVEACTSTS